MIKLRLFPLVILVAVAGFAAGCGGSDDTGSETVSVEGPMWTGTAPNPDAMSTADSGTIDAAARAAIKRTEGDLPGLWFAVWDPEKGMHVGAYGEAVVSEVEATTGDHSRIGSVTKTFTATAILKLVDEGELNLGDTVDELLPDVAADHPAIGAITVRQLIGMTSGIPDYGNASLVLEQVVDDPQRIWSASEIIDLSLTELKLERAGTGGYSTTNYLILGEILSELTGESAETVLNRTAEAAGLDQTKLPSPDDNAMPDPASDGYVNSLGAASLAASGIEIEPGLDVTDWTHSWGGAGGSMYSTVNELGAWAATGFGTAQLSESLGDERIATVNDLDGMGEYGLGVQHFGPDWIGHTGQIIGWEAIAMYNPETGGTIAAIVNETGSIGTVIEMILELYPELKAGFT